MKAPIIYGPGPEEPEPLRPVPDLAGTPVEDVEGHYTGTVFGALAEEETGLIRYLDLHLEGKDRHVLVPFGHARLEQERGRPLVHLRAATRDDLEKIPPYEPGRQEVDGPYQHAVLAAHGRVYHGERYYAHPAFDHDGLYAGEHPIVREPAAPRSAAPLERLSDLPGYQVASGEPDIRGWPLRDANGERAGTIDDLIVDAEYGKVRYVLLSLDDDDGAVLVPVGYLRIREDAEEVLSPPLSTDDLRALPRYKLGAVTREDEDEIRKILEDRLSGKRHYRRADFNGADV